MKCICLQRCSSAGQLPVKMYLSKIAKCICVKPPTFLHSASHLSEKSELCSLAGQLPATGNPQTRLNNGKQHTLPKIPHFGQPVKFPNFRFLPTNGRWTMHQTPKIPIQPASQKLVPLPKSKWGGEPDLSKVAFKVGLYFPLSFYDAVHGKNLSYIIYA